MSLQGFIDHCQAASAALAEWMEIYRHVGLAPNQAEADAARQYLETAATEIEAACKLSESVIQEVSDDVATAILAVTASAKRNVGEFFKCWQEHEPALLLAATRQRIPHPAQQKDQPKKEQAVASAMTVTITTQDACKMLDRHKSTLKRWADHAGIEKVANNVWSKSDIEKLARLRGIEL